MADLINLAERRDSTRTNIDDGAAAFIGCPRCDGTEFAVVVVRGARGIPVITALVCVGCDPVRQAAVESGMVGGWEN